ncbi:MAG: fatty acid desaturase family protein [Pirellulaceae bacterium]
MVPTSNQWISTARSVLQHSEVKYFKVKPLRYWFDFLLSVTIAYTAGSFYLESPLFSWQQLVAFPFTVFWLYRVGSLIHEVAHLSHQEMRTFKVVWNLVVGVVTLAPSPFFTRHHRDHHTQRMYGTPQDPEYVVNIWRRGSWQSMLAYLGMIAVFPLIVLLRFLLVPLTYLHPRLREWTLTRASSMTLNWHYVRKLNAQDRWSIAAVEWLCWLRAMLIPMAVIFGLTHWSRLPVLYVLAATIFLVNQLRQLADHQFDSDGSNMELSDHVKDSCNYTSRDFLTWLFFPFAIRYHALHHLFPTLPYHNLAAAHAYLLQELPTDSPYRELDQPHWWSVAQKMFRAQADKVRAVEVIPAAVKEPISRAG